MNKSITSSHPIIDWYVDNLGRKTSVEKTNETHKVVNNQIVLMEIPDEYNRVEINGFVEVRNGGLITQPNQFKVNYKNSFITFHESQEGQSITISKYYSKGLVLLPASRIYDDTSGQTLDTTKTLADFISSTKNLIFQGEFSYDKTYSVKELVNFGIDKSIYECVSPTTPGESPLSAPDKWLKFIDISDMINIVNDYANDTTSLYIAYDNGISITHNLNDYPMPHVLNISYGYGSGGYGVNPWGYGTEQPYQVLSKAQYPDMNTLKLFLNEQFSGTPTITQQDSRHYTITFTDATLKVILK